MLRLVFRPLLVLLTLGALVVAFVQVGGRILFAVLDDLEPLVNQALATRGVQVAGLSGDWRLLNPIIHAEHVAFPAGHLTGLTVEVDMVASALRGVPLARRLHVTYAHVGVEKPEGRPWRLVGSDDGPPPDFLPLLRHSEQLEVAGTVVLTREGQGPVEMGVTYLGINRGGEHRHTLSMVNAEDDCPTACELQADLHRQAPLWPLRPARARLTVRSDGFLLPKDLLGLSALKLSAVDLDWRQDELLSGGTLRLAVEQFDLPGDMSLAVRLEGFMRGRGAVQRGAVSRFQLQQGDQTWDLPPLAVHANAVGVSLWMSELDITRASGFLRQALAGLEPAERWLGALNPRGRAHNLRAHLPFDGRGVAYALTVDGLEMDGYRGAPRVRNGSGELFGFERGLQLNLNASDLSVAFPDLFDGQWQLPYAQGVLQAWFSRDYLGLRGLNLRAEVLGSRTVGNFALTRPRHDVTGQRLALRVSVEQLDVAEAKQFVPRKLSDGLRNWLARAPLEGTLSDARLAYQGQIRMEPGELGRRLELSARVEQGRVRYHPDWPEVAELSGFVAVMGQEAQVDVDSARSAGGVFASSQVRVLERGAGAELILDASLPSAEALNLVRTTPLRNWLRFVEPDWQAEGPLRLTGELTVPLGRPQAGASSPVDLDVRLRADLDGVRLDLPRYRMSLEALRGTVRYRYPYDVSAAGVRGGLFGNPVSIAVSAAPGLINLRILGRAASDDVWRLLDVPDPHLATGTFDYQAQLAVPIGSGLPVELQVTSPLEGLALSLPAGFGKPTDRADPAELNLSLGSPVRTASFSYRDVSGWVDFDDGPLRGAIGFGAAPPPVADDARELVVGGRIPRFAVADVAAQAPDLGLDSLPALPVRLDGLQFGEIALGGFPLTGATLRGTVAGDGFDMMLSSRQVRGRFSGGAGGPMKVLLQEVVLPPPKDQKEPQPGVAEDDRDPLDPTLIARLPAADVQVERLMRGEHDYGSWRFEMRPAGGVLHVRELEADVRGVRIAAPEGLRWHGDTNETHFHGTLSVDNLATVLPQWGYAPTIETESAVATASVSWVGSPAAVGVLKLRGSAEVKAQEGRFLEVDSAAAGAQRILSLLNFTAIAKRMTLNFSDVFGRGVSFDRLKSTVGFDEGLLEFVDPLQVDGTGSSFRITGTVDLRQRILNNEMVVTLPVSKGLPWYAGYVALANPLAGLGMLVGERVLRKPLEQFSSATYRIGGTVDDPEVKFVSVFDVPVAEPPAAPVPEDQAETAPATDYRQITSD